MSTSRDRRRFTTYLRRTVASGLQRLGFPLQVVEAVLNHVGSRAGIVGTLQGGLREARNRNLGQVHSRLKACARHMRWRDADVAVDKITGAIAIGVISERDVFRETRVPLEMLRASVAKYWAMFPEDRPIYERENRELEREKNKHAVKYGEAHHD